MPSDRWRGNDKQKHRRVPLKIQKQFLTVRVTEYWQRLLRQATAFEIYRSHVDMVLCNHL